MKTGKPKWRKPKLLVLVSEKKEEMILGGCKSMSGIEGPGTDIGGGCQTFQVPYVCSTITWS